jgi:hypothetical protein
MFTANCIFKITGWDERPVHEDQEELKITRASVTKTYQGDVQGEAVLEYLMVYKDESSAKVLGFERITGQVGDKSGSFILEHRGEYENDLVKIHLEVVPGSSLKELTGLTGGGDFEAGHAEEYPLVFKFSFEGKK